MDVLGERGNLREGSASPCALPRCLLVLLLSHQFDLQLVREEARLHRKARAYETTPAWNKRSWSVFKLYVKVLTCIHDFHYESQPS